MTPDTLREILKEVGWTQAKVSEKLGVSDRAVRKWLSGGTKKIPGPVAAYFTLLMAVRKWPIESRWW